MNNTQLELLKKNIFTIIFSLFLLLSCDNNADSILDDNPYHHLNNFALINANLIDGTGSLAIPNAVIVIQNGYIIDAGTDSEIIIPPGTDIIDLHDTYVLPGFINCHVHNAYNADNLKAWLQSGITSVRDMGNFSHSPSHAFRMRDDFNQDNTNARLIAVGPMVTTIDGYGNYEIASPEEAETKIEDLINKDADLIKIAIEDDLQGKLWPMLTQEEVNKIVQTAHRLNKKVSAHISRSMHVNMALAGDVDDLAHMAIDNVPSSVITSVIEQDMYWVPTLELWKLVSERHNLIWDEIALDNLYRFNRAGGKVALGTDFGGYDVDFELGMPMVEMQLMKQAGMSPMEIIISATKNAAIACDMEDKLGTIEVGKIADIIVVNTNPLEDLQVLSEVQIVIHNGKIIKFLNPLSKSLNLPSKSLNPPTELVRRLEKTVQRLEKTVQKVEKTVQKVEKIDQILEKTVDSIDFIKYIVNIKECNFFVHQNFYNYGSQSTRNSILALFPGSAIFSNFNRMHIKTKCRQENLHQTQYHNDPGG